MEARGRAHDVAVIGAGQAGLAISHVLSERGIAHVVLDRDGIAGAWAKLWDSFRLNTPNWSIRLPGKNYDGPDPDGFLSRDEIMDLLRTYAAESEAPVREGITVNSVDDEEGGFTLGTSDGDVRARCVAVCTGAYQSSFRPPAFATMPEDVLVVDPRTYRNPSDLPEGAVLVVGNGQSGSQIAEDLLDGGREVILSCGRAAWAPRRFGGQDLLWWALETGFLDQSVEDLPSPAARFAANVTASGVDGGHDLHVRTLRARGVTLTGRFLGCENGTLRFADDLDDSVAWADARYFELVDEVAQLCAERGIELPHLPDPEPFDPSAPVAVALGGIGAVVSAGGFRPGYDWMRYPRAFDDMGFPIQVDGASTVVPGLFFAGVHFLRRRRSSLLCGIGEDAPVVVDGIERFLTGQAS